MNITSPEATIGGALILALVSGIAGLSHWLAGRPSREERNAEFWRGQVVPLTDRVTSLEAELTRVKDAFQLEARTNAGRLQQVQLAHAETLRAVQDRADTDRAADASAAAARLSAVTTQYQHDREVLERENTALRGENAALRAARTTVTD